MPTLSSFRVLVAPGLYNSGPLHWQSRWQRLYPAFERVEQEHWDAPVLEVWSQRLQHQLRQSEQPALVIAHSFGCLTTVHAALTDIPNLAGALLVAPADPDKFDVSQAVRGKLSVPAIVVGSLNDPWMESGRARQWAQTWGADYVDAGALGHINAESNLGDWLYGQSLLQRLVQQTSSFPGARQQREPARRPTVQR
ncbi:serine hydrolase family protein [Collimonas arenae]|uniref:Serine hydrolase family protein n=1 Tax=Collimonas arenae TaxID=279058 RepID=A0A127PN82_9BURK|nr:alpha/beta hydrolase [Collimonas arenae]AMO99249.1 serine hydrolase family protein [Collimonas arenae]AMP09148.1 serine hydrolase family protein [Collimonas arenae]